MINPKAPLKLLADQIDWHYFEKEFANLYKNGPAQPPKSIRLMIGLLMLQHIAGISDQKVVETWAENPYWQYFVLTIISTGKCLWMPAPLSDGPKDWGRKAWRKSWR